MKITTILLFSACLTASAGGLAQKVTLSANNVKLEKVFKEIKKQTGYVFFYDALVLQGSKPVSINVKNESVEEALKESLHGQPLDFSIERKTVTIVRKAGVPIFKKQIKYENVKDTFAIKGTITNVDDNTPIEGVSIINQTTGTGTQTNKDGKFTIRVALGDHLAISHVGFANVTYEVKNNDDVFIKMAPKATTDLSEVVVVGYGTQKKVNLTGAIDQVSGERLESRPITNVSEGLQGVIANLNVTTTTTGGTPGAAKSINIRGYTGLGTSASPLILVDGVPADINTINPTDIESITVLKDAASSAIYGSRAPYGVILIKTREGKKNQPVTLSVNSSFLSSQPLNVPKMMNSLDFMAMMNEAAVNAGQAPRFNDDIVARVKAYMADPVNTPVTIADPTNPANWLSFVGGNANNDWFKIYLKDWSQSQQHNVSLNGGSDKITYFLGLGYNGKNGLFNYFNDSYKRYNLRANINANVNQWLSFGLRTAFSQSNFNAPSAGADIGNNWFHQIPRRFPTVPLIDPNGHYTQESYVPQIMNGGRNVDNDKDSWITGEMTVTPLKGWVINANYSFNYYTGLNTTTFLPYTYYNALNQPLTTVPINTNLTKTNANANYHTYNVYTSYEKQLSGHSFKALVGYQQEYRTAQSLTGSNNNLYSNSLPSLALTYGSSFSTTDAISTWATEGAFARFNYNFREKYLFEFNGRYDGSSRFPADRRYKFFPSFSVGYNVAKEDFWSHITDKVTTLKLRASYGLLGDQSSVGIYPYQTTLSTLPPVNTNVENPTNNWEFASGLAPFVRVGGLVDPNITWAKPSMLDFGVDVGAFNERLQVTFDWYKRKTTDLFGPGQAYSAVLGTSAPVVNNASIETRGFDLTLSWKDKIGNVGYNARFILSDYKGTVLNYPNPKKLINNWYNGMPIGTIWGYNTVGLFQSADEVTKSPSQSKIDSRNWTPGDVQYADLNGDNRIDFGNSTVDSSGDLSIIGNATPRYSYGFNLGLDWKGFDLNVFIQGIAKREFFPENGPTNANYFWGFVAGGNFFQATLFDTQLDRWSTDNPNGYFPKYYTNNQMGKNMQTSTRYMLNAAYFRVKNLQLGYTLPETLTKKAHISRLRIYGSVENLLTIAPGLKRFKVDPELLLSDAKIYPIQRTFSVGLNLNLQ